VAKRTLYILLLILLFLQSGGILLICHLQQEYTKYQMMEKMERSETLFEKMTLTKEEFKKYRINDDELSINGIMYDIKSSVIHNNSIELLVINDEEEAKIQQKINAIAKTTNSSDSNFSLQLQQIISLVYLPVSSGILSIPLKSTSHLFSALVPETTTLYQEIAAPPPKLS
jgi:hypothetical protein